jgi:RNA polymerase sigma-70 factor (ECF subfamily)
MEHRKASNSMNEVLVTEVLAAAREGDPEAWGHLYRQYAPAIFRFCRRSMPTREDAEDATAEIFIKVREKLGQYDATRPFSAWLYTVSANHCWDILRRRRVRQDLETGDVDDMPLAHPDPGQLERLMTDSTNHQLRSALEKMPARARMALVLRYYSEMSYDEIADTLGVRRTFVGVLLLRARHQLREIISATAGGDLQSAAGGKA